MKQFIFRVFSVCFVVLFLSNAQAQIVDLDPELLHPNEAYVVSGDIQDQNLIINIDIAPEYYLYSDKIYINVESGDLQLGQAILPEGLVHTDEFFGQVSIFRNQVAISVPITNQPTSTDSVINVQTQGCADLGVCFPPYVAKLAFDQNQGQGTLLPYEDFLTTNASINSPVDNTSALEDVLANQSFVQMLFVFFGAGLLLALTPCVLPMIPIILAVISRGSNTQSRTFFLGLTYVFGMAIVYTVLGVVAAKSGQLLSVALQTPIVLIPLALIFVLLGFVILFEANLTLLPSKVVNFLEKNKGKPGTFKSAGLAGAISAIVVSPCVAAPLLGALLFISSTGDVVVGGSALLALSLGMGVLPLACLVGAHTWLPQAGPLSGAIRKIFGFAMLGLAVWVLGGLIPGAIRLVLYGIIFLLATWPLLASFKDSTSNAAKSLSGVIAFLLVFTSGIYVVGGVTGGTNELAPLAHLTDGQKVEFEYVVTTEKEYLDLYATPVSQKTFEYYTADWCISCKEIEAKVFLNPDVVEALNDYRLIKIDVTANTKDSQILLEVADLFGPPAIIVRNENRRNLLKIVGTVSDKELLEKIEVIN